MLTYKSLQQARSCLSILLVLCLISTKKSAQTPDGCGLNHEPIYNSQQNQGQNQNSCQLSSTAFPSNDIDIIPNVPNARL